MQSVVQLRTPQFETGHSLKSACQITYFGQSLTCSLVGLSRALFPGKAKLFSEGGMKSLLQDLRYSLRQLKSSPGFSITAILSLALGIAATTAVFSVLYAVVMNPYPYRAADRMVHMRLVDRSEEHT